jgi:hypothetical protein
MLRAALLVCVGTTFALAPKQAALADRYPITFSMEDEYSNETSLIPEGIWKALTQDSSVREVMSNELPRATEPPRSWFRCHRITLGNRSQTDFIIQGSDRLAGANVTSFWVFIQSPQDYELVLDLPAHDLIVARESHQGYRNIKAAAMTAVRLSMTTFCFRGHTYVVRGK